MLFTNKHVIIAMIVAPVLAVLAWVGTGYFSDDAPTPAVAGESYPLLEKSNCRYPSGACDLENEDFRLTLVQAGTASATELVLRSAYPLDGVVLGIGVTEQDAQPRPMRASDGQGLEWRVVTGRALMPEERIRLVAIAGGSTYFGDVATAFLQPRED